ncbi:MAG TPA: tautomerase family protein [Selenomonadales bacterium]|nr:tautomerase family protein [Selenomonadales bacterium]
MPIITVEGPQISKEQKRQLVGEITKAASDIIRLPAEYITVLIKENGHDNIGVGGSLLSDAEAQ